MLCLALSLGAAPSFIWADARIVRLDGMAEKRAAGQLDWERVTQGERIAEGASLRTGADGLIELVTDSGHRLRLKAASLFHLVALQPAQTEGKLEQGRVFSTVKHLKRDQRFAIQTPSAVCAVRGTEFETAVGHEGTWVAVYRGIVGVAIPGGAEETAVKAGQMSVVRDGVIETPKAIQGTERADGADPLAREAKREVGLDMSRADVIAAAAYEQRYADYTEGKSLIDAEGRRVRLEEYIVRTQANAYKFVVLNHRDDRLDYFYYKGTFNRDLPTDLSVALREQGGKYGETAPDYYLTEYEMAQSNTQDSIRDNASGGHLVKIARNSDGDYVLTDQADPTNTRTVSAAELQLDGTYKVYNPLTDSYSTVSAASAEAAKKIAFYVPATDSYRDFSAGDTYWKTRYNTYSHLLNGAEKIHYQQSGAANTLVTRLDATFRYAGGFVLPVVTSSADRMDVTLTNYYGDGTFERYRTLLIDDNGAIAPASAFEGLSTGAGYRNEILKWNYEQQATATEFAGRSIDLVVEPRIFIRSGQIQ